MKICSKCKLEKPKSEFNKNSYKKDGLQIHCRDCTKEANAFSYKHSEKRRASIRKRNVDVALRNQKILKRYKSFVGCVICREKDPIVLDLHHVNEVDKLYDPAKTPFVGLKAMRIEIRKCVVLCSNCHRRLHADRFCLIGV